jgi:hypothetical protein
LERAPQICRPRYSSAHAVKIQVHNSIHGLCCADLVLQLVGRQLRAHGSRTIRSSSCRLVGYVLIFAAAAPLQNVAPVSLPFIAVCSDTFEPTLDVFMVFLLCVMSNIYSADTLSYKCSYRSHRCHLCFPFLCHVRLETWHMPRGANSWMKVLIATLIVAHPVKFAGCLWTDSVRNRRTLLPHKRSFSACHRHCEWD